MRITVNVLALTAENAPGPYQAEALAAFKQRNFAIPVDPDDTFEAVWRKIEDRYVKNYLEPAQATFFTIKKLQDGWDCDLDLGDTVGSIFPEKLEQKDRVIKVIPSFVNRAYSMPITSNLRPNPHKRARESGDNAANKRLRQEAELEEMQRADPGCDRPVGSVETTQRAHDTGSARHSFAEHTEPIRRSNNISEDRRNPARVDKHTSTRSQSAASLVFMRALHQDQPEFAAAVKEESPELGMPSPRAVPESPAITSNNASAPTGTSDSALPDHTPPHQEPTRGEQDHSISSAVRDQVSLLNGNRSSGNRISGGITYGRRTPRTTRPFAQLTDSDESQSEAQKTAPRRGGLRTDKIRLELHDLEDGPSELPLQTEATSGKQRHAIVMKKVFPDGVENTLRQHDHSSTLDEGNTPVTTQNDTKKTAAAKKTPAAKKTSVVKSTPTAGKLPVIKKTPATKKTSVTKQTPATKESSAAKKTPAVRNSASMQRTPDQQTSFESPPLDSEHADFKSRLFAMTKEDLLPLLAARQLTPKHNGLRTKTDQIRRILQHDQEHGGTQQDQQHSGSQQNRRHSGTPHAQQHGGSGQAQEHGSTQHGQEKRSPAEKPAPAIRPVSSSPPRTSPRHERRSSSEQAERAEEQAVQEFLGLEADLETGDKSESPPGAVSVASSTRSSPPESRSPAKWQDAQSESEEESVASRSRSHSRASSEEAASVQSLSSEEDDSDDDSSEATDTIEVNGTAPIASPGNAASPSPAVASSQPSAVIPDTQPNNGGGSQPLPRRSNEFARWLSSTQPTPPAVSSERRTARSRAGYSLRNQLMSVQSQPNGGPSANRTVTDNLLKTGDLSKLGKTTTGGLPDISDDSSSDSSSSEDD